MKKLTRLIVILSVLLLPASLVAQQAGNGTALPEKGKIASNESESVTSPATQPVIGATAVQDKQEKKTAPPYDQAPEAKTVVNPKYPDSAFKAGTEGTVYTQVSIDETGKVTKVTITKSDVEIFNQASIDAAMQWAFKPALKDGKPVATEVAIPFRFKIGKGGELTDYSQPGIWPLIVTVGQRPGYRVMRQHPYLIGQSPTPSNDWYPASAIKDKFEGIVGLKLTVNLGGRVERVEIENHAREDLDSAAVRLARTLTFIPGQANGMPEKVMIRVPVSFFLDRPMK